MAIKIPTYENQVSPPSGGAPLAVPNLSSPPPSAFGTEAAQGLQQTGAAVAGIGDKLAQHMIEQNRQEQHAQVIDADTKFRKELQDTMFSTEPDPERDNMPKGVFSRMLGQTKGATEDFDAQYDGLKKKYLGQFTNPVQQMELAKSMDDSYAAHRQLVIHHEATQVRENRTNIIDSNLKQMINDAGNLVDPKAFLTQVQLGHDRMYAMQKENGYDDASIAANTAKFSSDMAKSALIPMIKPDPSVAYSYLDSIKSVLSPTDTAELKKVIDVQSRQLDELAKHEKEKVYDTNMRSAMLDMFDGNLTLSEAERRFRNDTLKKSDYDILESKLVKPDYQVLREMQSSDNSAFTDIRQAQLNGTKTPGEISRMIAQGNADGKINSDDAKYLDKLTKAVPPDPRDQHVSAQGQSVEDFAKRYFTEHVGDFLPVKVPGVSGIQVKKEQTANDVKALTAEFYKRVDKEGAQGERVDQIANEVMGQFIKKRYPEVNRLPDIPHIVVGIDGKIQRLLNPGQKTKLKGQYKLQKTNNSDSRDYMQKMSDYNKSQPTVDVGSDKMDFDGEMEGIAPNDPRKGK